MKLAGPRAGLPQVPAVERVVGEIGKKGDRVTNLLARATSFELCQPLCLLPVEGARGKQGAQHSFLSSFFSSQRVFTPLSPVISLESPLDCKEIKPVNPKGNQP